jgi:hypothetical protein
MAEDNNRVDFTPDNFQCCAVKIGSNCSNCVLLMNRLHKALEELKTMKTITAVLNADLHNASTPGTVELQPVPSPKVTKNTKQRAYKLNGDKWYINAANNDKYLKLRPKYKEGSTTRLRDTQPI